DKMDHEPCHTALPRVRNLADIFQLIVDGLDPRSLPQEQVVPEADHTIFHVLTDFCEQGSSTPNRGAMKLSSKRGASQTSRGHVSTPSQENGHGPPNGILPQ